MVNVVFHTAFVGDLLLAIPFLKQIKKEFPAIPLVLITQKSLSDFFLQHGLVDQVLVLDKKNILSVQLVQQQLKKLEILNLFCPHNSFRSAWILKGVKAKNKIAYRQWWNRWFFNKRILRRMNLPEALRLVDLLGAISISVEKRMIEMGNETNFLNKRKLNTINDWGHLIPHDLTMLVPVDSNFQMRLLKKLAVQKPFVILAPCSEWNTKRWIAEGYISVAKKLSNQGFHIYLVGSVTDSEKCVDLQRKASSPEQITDIRSLAGQTDLVELHALLAAAIAVITNDSGPMHMAAVAGRPVVSIFGPTTLELGYRPWTDQSVVLQKSLSCRPCGKHGHKVCPIGTHECMKSITENDVLAALDSIVR